MPAAVGMPGVRAPRRRSRRLTALLAVPLVVTLAGCSATVSGTGRPAGSASPSFAVTGPPFGASGDDGTAAYQQMVTDMTGLRHGFAVSFGDRTPGSPAAIVSRYQGRDGTARVTYGGVRGDVVGVDGQAWVKAPEAFWARVPTVDAAIRPQIADRWVTVTGPLDVFRSAVDQQALFDGIEKFGSPGLGPVTTRDGEQVQAISLGGTVELQVTLASPHRLVQYGEPDFSSFSFPTDDLDVKAPSDPLTYPG